MNDELKHRADELAAGLRASEALFFHAKRNLVEVFFMGSQRLVSDIEKYGWKLVKMGTPAGVKPVSGIKPQKVQRNGMVRKK